MPGAPSNPQLPRNSLPASGKLAKRNASASAALHHWRAREGHPSAGGSTSSSCCGAGMLSPYPFPRRAAPDIRPYPANLCPPWCYVVNEVRRLADDYDDYLVARLTSECKPDAGGLSTLRKHVVGAPSYDNFEQKKNDSLLDVHLAITLEILAGILALIGSWPRPNRPAAVQLPQRHQSWRG